MRADESFPGRALPMERQAWIFVGMGVVVAAAVLHALIVQDKPNLLWGISVSLLLAGLLAAYLGVSLSGAGASTWWLHVIMGGLVARLTMSLANLAVGMWVLEGNVDFVGYPFWAKDIGDVLLQGRLPDMNEMFGTNFIGRLGAVIYLVADNHLVGMFLVSALLGFLGSYAFLRSVHVALPGWNSRFYAVMIFFLPSFTFWTSALGKDSWMFLFLGGVAYFYARLLDRFAIAPLLGLALCVSAASLVRLHVGLVLIFAIGLAWLFQKKNLRGPARFLRPVAVGLLLLVFGFGLLKLASSTLVLHQVTRFAAEDVVEYLAKRREALGEGAGTRIAVQLSEPTVTGLVRFLPYGMFTYLFRPLLFEAASPLLLLAALESSLFLVLIATRWRRLVTAARGAWRNPYLVFCWTAFLGMTAVLSIQSNFGLIIRQRTQVLPFLLMLLATPLPEGEAGTRTASAGEGVSRG